MQLLSTITLACAVLGAAAQSLPTNNIVQNVAALNATGQGKDYTLASALKLAGSVKLITDALSATDKNSTLFAPTDDAFKAFAAAFPQELIDLQANQTTLSNALLYHTTAGTFLPAGQPAKQFVPTGFANNWLRVDTEGKKVTLFFNGGNATVIDSIPSANGVIHVINKVLATPPAAAVYAKANGLDKLVDAVVQSNLTDAVNNLNNATLFAPTDAAFDTVMAYAKDNKVELNATTLQGILRFHVVPGTYFSTQVIALKTAQLATLLEGQNVTVTAEDGAVKVIGAGQTELKLVAATVTKADILVSGGVAHVIDAVLVPNLNAAAANGNKTTGANADKPSAASVAAYSAPLALGAVAAAMALAL